MDLRASQVPSRSMVGAISNLGVSRRLRTLPDPDHADIWLNAWRSQILLSRFSRGSEDREFRECPRIYVYRRSANPEKKILGASKWKKVFILLVYPFIFLFDVNEPNAKTRGAIYLGGNCHILYFSNLDGRSHIVCIMPITCRAPTRVSRTDDEDNFYLSFLTEEDASLWYNILVKLVSRRKGKHGLDQSTSSKDVSLTGTDFQKSGRSRSAAGMRSESPLRFFFSSELRGKGRRPSSPGMRADSSDAFALAAEKPDGAKQEERPAGGSAKGSRVGMSDPDSPFLKNGGRSPRKSEGSHSDEISFPVVNVSQRSVVLLTTEAGRTLGSSSLASQVQGLVQSRPPIEYVEDYPSAWILHDVGYEVARKSPMIREVIFSRRHSFFSRVRTLAVNTDYIHHLSVCRECGAKPISGFMYVCDVCAKKDEQTYCGRCFHNIDHDPRHYFRVMPDPVRCAAPLENTSMSLGKAETGDVAMYNSCCTSSNMISTSRRRQTCNWAGAYQGANPPSFRGDASSAGNDSRRRPTALQSSRYPVAHLQNEQADPIFSSASSPKQDGGKQYDIGISSYISPSLEGPHNGLRNVELVFLESVFRLVGRQGGDGDASNPIPKTELIYFWNWSGVSDDLMLKESDLSQLCRRIDSVSFDEFVFIVRCKLMAPSTFTVIKDSAEYTYLGDIYDEITSMFQKAQASSGSRHSKEILMEAQRAATSAGINRLMAMLRAFDFAELASSRKRERVEVVYVSQLMLITFRHWATVAEKKSETEAEVEPASHHSSPRAGGTQGSSGGSPRYPGAYQSPRVAKAMSQTLYNHDVAHYYLFDPSLANPMSPTALLDRSDGEVRQIISRAAEQFPLTGLELMSLLVLLQSVAAPRKVGHRVLSHGILKPHTLVDEDYGKDDKDGSGGEEGGEHGLDGMNDLGSGTDLVVFTPLSVVNANTNTRMANGDGTGMEDGSTQLQSHGRGNANDMSPTPGNPSGQPQKKYYQSKTSLNIRIDPSASAFSPGSPAKKQMSSSAFSPPKKKVEEVVPFSVCCSVIQHIMNYVGAVSEYDTHHEALLELVRYYYSGVGLEGDDLECYPTRVLRSFLPHDEPPLTKQDSVAGNAALYANGSFLSQSGQGHVNPSRYYAPPQRVGSPKKGGKASPFLPPALEENIALQSRREEGLFLTLEEAFYWIVQVWSDRDKLSTICVNINNQPYDPVRATSEQSADGTGGSAPHGLFDPTSPFAIPQAVQESMMMMNDDNAKYLPKSHATDRALSYSAAMDEVGDRRSALSKGHSYPRHGSVQRVISEYASPLVDIVEETLMYGLGEGLGLYTTQPETIHPCRCNECNCCPIIGYMYHCDHCDDYDLCTQCFTKEGALHNRNHLFVRFPDGKLVRQLM